VKKKIFVKGPILSQSGYGEQARFALRALRSREDLFEIYIHPITWGETGWLWEDNEFRRWMDRRITETAMLGQQKQLAADISLQITIPNEWEKIAPINIGYTAGIETTAVAPQWLVKGNDMDKILVVSEHAKKTFVETVATAKNNETGEENPYRLETPVEVVHERTVIAEPSPVEGLDFPNKFNFLIVSQMGPRKNMENAVKWWVEEFIDQNVGLIIKTNFKGASQIDREMLQHYFNKLLEPYKERKCKIHILHGDLSNGQMSWLYRHEKIKCLVNIAHGEGFGLPIFEAASAALPIITIGWSGQKDILEHGGKQYYTPVNYGLQPIPPQAIWKGVLEEGTQWAYADQGSYKMALRKVKKNWKAAKKKATSLQGFVEEKFEKEHLYKQFVSHFHKDDTEHITIDQVPKISLITSVFDAEEHIEQFMEDVTRQTIFEEKCEWVILNVDPPDKNFSENVIMKYVEKYPNNIVYKRLKEDPGVYGVWNEAIGISTGEFVTNVNCDDRRSILAYEKQAKTLIANPDIDLVYNDSYVVHEANAKWDELKENTQRYNFEQFSKEAMLRGNLPHNNPMWRKSLHKKYGLFDAEYKSAADWDFWLRCAFGGAVYKKHTDILGIYYFNPEGISTNPENNSWKQEEEFKIFKKYQKLFLEEKNK